MVKYMNHPQLELKTYNDISFLISTSLQPCHQAIDLSVNNMCVDHFFINTALLQPKVKVNILCPYDFTIKTYLKKTAHTYFL